MSEDFLGTIPPQALQPYTWDTVFLDTHAHKDHEQDKLSPDILLYHSNDLPEGDLAVSAASEVTIIVAAEYKDHIKGVNKSHQESRKMMLPNRDNPDTEKPFLISYPPVYTARSPFARATRAMLAFDLTTKCIVFLKDYWRVDVEGMKKEGEIYRILEEKNVLHIAPFGMGNDVKDHKTITQMWTTMPRVEWVTSTTELILLRHYRMTLDVVGRVLTEFESSRQFVSAIADAMEGHDDAYFIANILHRDISVGNILLTDDKQGMLIDWDLCVNLANRSLVPRRPSRTGTWQFMSAVLLNNASSPHDLLDDRESAFHVLLWVALQYTKHTVQSPPTPFANTSTSANSNWPLPNKAAKILQAFEEAWVDPDGNVRGGSTKRIFFTTDDLSRLQFRDRPELDSLIQELVKNFHVRYGFIPSAEEVATLKAVMDAGLGEEHIRTQPAYVYQDRMGKLAQQGWLVETIRRFLGRGIWPEDDKAEYQHHVAPRDSMAPSKTGSKRKALELDKNDEDQIQRPAGRASSCLHRC